MQPEINVFRFYIFFAKLIAWCLGPPLCTYRLNWVRYYSATKVPHHIESLRLSGEEIFFSLKLEGQSKVRTRDLRLSKQAALTTAPGPPHIFFGMFVTNMPLTMLAAFCDSK